MYYYYYDLFDTRVRLKMKLTSNRHHLKKTRGLSWQLFHLEKKNMADLSQQVETALGKARELAIKVSEREKFISNLRSQISLGEREYEMEKTRLEASVLELDAKKQKLIKVIAQRKRDLSNISSAVAQLEESGETQSLNRSLAFVPSFPKAEM